MKKIEPLKVAKFATRLVVGVGTGMITKQIIGNNVVTENAIQKFAVTAAGVVIGWKVSSIAEDHACEIIDELVKALKDTNDTPVVDL